MTTMPPDFGLRLRSSLTTIATALTTAAVLGLGPAAAASGGPEGAGSALSLDGNGGEATAPVEMDLDAFTVEAWVRVTSLTDRASDGGSVMTHAIGSDQSFSVWLFDRSNDEQDQFQLAFQVNYSNGSSQIVVAPVENHAPFEIWHHVATTYDGQTATLLLNGAVVAQELIEIDINWVPGGRLSIGHEFPGASEWIGGELDEVRVWSRVRTPAEVADTRFDALCGDEADLWALYQFEDGTAADVTGQGRDLDLVAGAETLPSTAPITAAGDCGSCPADFDASGSVDFADLLSTLALWGPCPSPCPQDLDGTGDVAFDDVLLVLAAWGPCP